MHVFVWLKLQVQNIGNNGSIENYFVEWVILLGETYKNKKAIG